MFSPRGAHLLPQFGNYCLALRKIDKSMTGRVVAAALPRARFMDWESKNNSEPQKTLRLAVSGGETRWRSRGGERNG
jgi:hypothetical protein